MLRNKFASGEQSGFTETSNFILFLKLFCIQLRHDIYRSFVSQNMLKSLFWERCSDAFAFFLVGLSFDIRLDCAFALRVFNRILQQIHQHLGDFVLIHYQILWNVFLEVQNITNWLLLRFIHIRAKHFLYQSSDFRGVQNYLILIVTQLWNFQQIIYLIQ